MSFIQMPSPNFDERNEAIINMIILHYTGMKNSKVALERLTDETSEVSAHYTIDEDGTIYAHVDEGKRAWHAGVSSWQGRTNINACSIGIEIVNPGHEQGYKDFPDVQIKAVVELCQEIMRRHEIEFVLAHSDVAPMRKEDPGERFPWAELAKENIGVWPIISVEDMVKGSSIDVYQALNDLGYEAKNNQKMLIAFQRHYVPEVFENGTEGQACSLTKARLYALLSRY
jgi:N-acetylmuramoyl-L-alanine amidase